MGVHPTPTPDPEVRALLDLVEDAVLLVEPLRENGGIADFQVVCANEALGRLLGRTGEDLTGRPLRQLLPSVLLAVDHSLARVHAGGAPERFEVDLGAGRRVIVRTARQRAEQVAVILRLEPVVLAGRSELEAAMDALMNGISQALIITDPEGGLVRMNAAARELHGITDVGSGSVPDMEALFEVHYPDGRLAPTEEWPLVRAIRGERVEGEILHARRKDGSRSWIGSYSAAPVRDATGRTAFIVVTIHDLTPMARTEQALRESEARLRRAIVDAPLPVVLHADDGEILEVSRAWMEITGYSREELSTMGAWTERAYGERAPKVRAWIRRLFDADAAVAEGEFRIRTKDGGRRVWAFGSAPLGRLGDRRLAISMAMDVTERRAAEEALREADRRKDEFLGMLSHELRNPLAPIRHGVDLLRQSAPGSPEAARAQEAIARQVDHLTRLVNDLLDVTRITRGRITLQRERVDLAEIVRRAMEDHRADFAEKGVKLEGCCPQVSFWVDGDPTRLSQIVGNLLHNAAKFTDPGGRTEVNLDRDPAGWARLVVRDTGIGISSDIRARLFQPFTQADATLARRSGGLGLGLAVVKGLVEEHGGAIEAHSDGAGSGAVFTVTLPLTEAPVESEVRPRPRRRIAPRRVLVIEDNEDAAGFMKDLLTLRGHEVTVAHDGAEGVAAARAVRPDAVLCDLGLPVLDGYEVARELRADPALRGTFLVALSGYARPEDQDRSREAGFDRHLAKPARIDALEAVIGEAPAREAPRV